MMDVVVDQKVFVCKDLFGFSLIDAVALLTFPRVAFVPLKADYVAKVNYLSHLPVRLQGKASAFNPHMMGHQV